MSQECYLFILHPFCLERLHGEVLYRYEFFPTYFSTLPQGPLRDASLAANFRNNRFSKLTPVPIRKPLAAHGFIQAGHLAIAIAAPEVKFDPVVFRKLVKKTYNTHGSFLVLEGLDLKPVGIVVSTGFSILASWSHKTQA